MPGTRCAVAYCQNSLEETKKQNLRISYHRFPKEEYLLHAWIQACSRGEIWNPATSYVCSVHFQKDDFEWKQWEHLMNIPFAPIRSRLKSTAIPTLFLKFDADTRNKVLLKQKAVVEENRSLLDTEIREIPVLGTSSNVSSCRNDIKEEPVPSTSSIVSSQNDELKQLKRHYAMLQKKYNDLQNSFAQQSMKVKQQYNEIQNMKHDFQKQLNENIEDILSGSFGRAQRDILMLKNKKIIWTTEEISKAFTLRYLSKISYLYLNNILHYPLPHTSTLVKWARNFDFKGGILKGVLKVMKTAGIVLNDFEKTTVLQYDEMKVGSVFEYYKAKDEILGPYSQMQVVIARGLFSNWKQPVYINFDRAITQEILMEVLIELHNINYNVVACVSNCERGNLELLKDLNISFDQCYFHHPSSKEKIYMFVDTPHLLKLLRNCLLDTGFVLEDGEVINKKPLEQLINMDSCELTSCYKLTKKHIDCKGTERQNVALASQLLSHTTASALLCYNFGSNQTLAISAGHFIGIMSTWFDIMTSYDPKETHHVKKPYGLMLENQNEHLDQAYIIS